MTKRLDPDFKGLKGCVRAMEGVAPRMRRATLEFLWDRYITHPKAKESPTTAGRSKGRGTGNSRKPKSSHPKGYCLQCGAFRPDSTHAV